MTEEYKASHHLSPHQPMGCRIRVAARKVLQTSPILEWNKKTHTEKNLCEDVDCKRGATSVNGQMILPFSHSPLTRSCTIRGAYLKFLLLPIHSIIISPMFTPIWCLFTIPTGSLKTNPCYFLIALIVPDKNQMSTIFWILGRFGSFLVIWRISKGDLAPKINFLLDKSLVILHITRLDFPAKPCYTTYNKAWLSSQAFLKVILLGGFIWSVQIVNIL